MKVYKKIKCWGDAVVGHRVRVLTKNGKHTVIKDTTILNVKNCHKPITIQTPLGQFNTNNYILLNLSREYDNKNLI
jgi:hypothetical protein